MEEIGRQKTIAGETIRIDYNERRFQMSRSWIGRLPFMSVRVTFLVLSTTCMAANPSWGVPSNHLRLGLEWGDSSNDDSIIITLTNVGTAPKDVMFEAGGWAAFEFIATAPDGIQYQLLDRLKFVVAGLMPSRLIEHVAPGAVLKFTVPLRRFVYIPDRRMGKYSTNMTLGDLFKDDCNAHAVFKVDKRTWMSTERIGSKWVGEMSSGNITMPKAQQTARPIDHW